MKNSMHPGGLTLTEMLIRQANLASGATVLDVGCGKGASSALLIEKGCRVIGLERDDTLLREAERLHPQGNFILGDAVALPLKTASVEGVLVECVLSVVPTQCVLSECARVLKSGGKLLISDVYDRSEGIRLTQKWWQEQLEAAGFDLVTDFTDQTPYLRDFIAQLIWDSDPQASQKLCLDCVSLKKPGYFSVVAQRRTPNV